MSHEIRPRSVGCRSTSRVIYAVLAGLLCGAFSPRNIASLAAAADDGLFDVALRVSPREVEIAQPLEVTITATAPRDCEIWPPPLPLAMSLEMPDFRVIDSNDETELRGGQIVWTRRLVLEAYAPGRKTLAPLEVAFVPPHFDEQAGAESPQILTLETEAIPVRVRSALGLFESGSELRSIYAEAAVPWTWRQWAMLLGGLVVGVGGAAFVVRWVDRFHDDSGRASHPSLLRDLQRLREAWLLGSASDEETVAAASDIARRWLQRREGAPQIYRTTAGWAGRVQRGDAAAEAAIVEVLRRADRVKFAQAEPTLDEVRDSLEQVRLVMQSARGPR